MSLLQRRKKTVEKSPELVQQCLDSTCAKCTIQKCNSYLLTKKIQQNIAALGPLGPRGPAQGSFFPIGGGL